MKNYRQLLAHVSSKDADFSLTEIGCISPRASRPYFWIIIIIISDCGRAAFSYSITVAIAFAILFLRRLIHGSANLNANSDREPKYYKNL